MGKRRLTISLLLAVLLTIFAFPHLVKAETLPNTPQYDYYDQTGTLNDETKKLVGYKNNFYTTTKAKPQVMVALLKSTGGDDIDSYAPDLFQKWGLGQKGSDNGILILYAVNGGQRNVRIEVGYGMESVVTDSIAGRILQNNKANLKSSDPQKINAGLQKTFNSVTSLIDDHYHYKKDKNSLSDAELAQIKGKSGSSSRGWWPFVGLVVAILIVAYILGKNGRGGSGPGNHGGGDGIPWWLWLGGFGNSGGGSWGGGSGGSSGGFGGFSGGGGSSGGGGASI